MFHRTDTLLGDGNDSLNLQYVVGDQVTYDGGAGYDSLSKAVPGPINTLHQTGWEVINGRRVLTTWFNYNDAVLTKATF